MWSVHVYQSISLYLVMIRLIKLCCLIIVLILLIMIQYDQLLFMYVVYYK